MSTDVLALLPRVGLANRLLVWSRAMVCGRQLRAPVATRGWGHLHLGPILRGESSYRFYARQISTNGGHFRSLKNRLLASLGKRDMLFNVPLDELEAVSGNTPTTYIYNKIPHYSDYFAGLRGHEKYLSDALWRVVNPRIRNVVESHPRTSIALHVRRGDFVTINRELSTIDYFVSALEKIRAVEGSEVQARVFSDGKTEQLQPLLDQPGVVRHERIGDMADLLLMSRSRYVVTSLRSTFGYFAGFVSDGAIVLDDRHGASRIRSEQCGLFEGSVEQLG